ncbi:cation:proton antiporter family protein [Alteromonas sp. 14N.309.X.WAT.G.H12]|uniref:cation:proton antiporter family protein n=1 Tax=Alteromonas sp. 14N.309.X.WAT.G.H12 TaxID=3120824 RepID=UPI002FCF0AFB
MDAVVIWLGCAFIFGFGVQRVGFPPLIGYLMTGFGLTYASQHFGYSLDGEDALREIGNIGVLILLFTVGLKLDVSEVFKKEVFGTSALHMALSILVYATVIHFVFSWEWATSLLLGSLLSFSSTVLAANSLEERQELRAFHGRMAIGILIVQDLGAMELISITSNEAPRMASLGLMLLCVSRPVFHKVLDWCGHGGILILLGLTLAIVGGEVLFHHVLGLSAELGALVMGAMCAKHFKASELYSALWPLKEVFLVGFFMTIGLNGLPSWDDVYFAVVVVALLPFQALFFFFLLVSFKLKVRTAFLTTAALTNFSEFGLIVAAKVMPEWTIPLAVAVSFSFLISAPLNKYAHTLFDHAEKWLKRFERDGYHPDEAPMTLGATNILIVGLGQIGRAAFKEALRSNQDKVVLGIDSDAEKVTSLKKLGDYNVTFADADHANFWRTLDTSELDSVILTCEYDAALIAIVNLRKQGFDGDIIAHSKYEDQARKMELAGANHSHMTLHEAGKGLLSHL